ncbi:AMP-binding protein [Amycolatopsis sp. CA-230715]|uniref:AMP-binding protein n=1 Tax=Amycolatopsis sp. CA-230715 TaxID=2745196 RepID=UPI001C00B4A6|nr:AMP-binding protein [Amycolatopsis sp. CA-230715]
MGVLFEECADRGVPTVVQVDRPFDIAPDAGLSHDMPALARLVREASGWLAAAGAGPGDRVAIVKRNHWDYDLLACAAIRLGAVPAQLSGHLGAEALRELLKRLDSALLVTDAEILRRCRDEGVELPSLARRVLSLDAPEQGALVLADVRGTTPPAPKRPVRDEPLVVNHTSGTTGVPKLVVHSTGTIIGTLAGLESNRLPVVGVRRDDTLVNASSYAHGRTFCWTASVCCLAPRRIVVLTGSDPAAADPVLRSAPPTVVEALPSSYVRFAPLLSRLDNPFRDVRLYISTYDAVHPPTVRAYLTASAARRPLWMQGWGQTETGPITFRFFTRRSVSSRGDRHPTTRNLGRPVPVRTRLKVVDPETFRPVARGAVGLVLVRTPARCLGYLGEERRWAAKQDGNWWNTGDLARRGRDGSVVLLDREVDSVPELSCLETEDLLEDRLPEVLECVVLGTADGPPLPVLVTDDAVPGEQWDTATRDLPPLREPVQVRWKDVPRTGTGKVRRLALLRALTGQSAPTGTGRWT